MKQEIFKALGVATVCGAVAFFLTRNNSNPTFGGGAVTTGVFLISGGASFIYFCGKSLGGK